jgi:UV DNA damage endonuclease
MRYGYACLNHSVGATMKTFRLASYSPGRLVEAVRHNLDSLEKALRFNTEHGLLFFRISSTLVPFASHPICQFAWKETFKPRLKALGELIRSTGQRISMHPDQFTLLNSPVESVTSASVAELHYHADLLEALGLDRTAKIQIHVGGRYGDPKAAIERFVQRYAALSPAIRSRLVIENDDRLFSLADCRTLYAATGVPILFDVFHHQLLNQGEPVETALRQASATWTRSDGPPMVDYSSQAAGTRVGKHADSIDLADFAAFWQKVKGIDFDLMLEIRDKERSALRLRDFLKGSVG